MRAWLGMAAAAALLAAPSAARDDPGSWLFVLPGGDAEGSPWFSARVLEDGRVSLLLTPPAGARLDVGSALLVLNQDAVSRAAHVALQADGLDVALVVGDMAPGAFARVVLPPGGAVDVGLRAAGGDAVFEVVVAPAP